MLSASIEVGRSWRDRFYFGIGYTATSWLDGSRSISIDGWDDVDDETAPFSIEEDDFFVHGVFARGNLRFGN
jgi:hypothetical protein